MAKDLQNPISLSYNNNKQYPVQWHNQTPNPPKQMPQNTISHNQSYIQFPKRDKYNSLNYNGGGPNTSYFGPEVDMEENGGGIRNIRGNNQYKYNQYRKYNKYNENTLDNKYKNPESQTKQSTPRYSPHPSNIFPSFPPGKSEESKRSKSMVKARSRGMHPNYITNPTYPESNMSLRPHVSSLLEARQTKLQSQGDAMYHLFMGMDINMRKSTDKRRGELDNLQIKPYANTHLTRKLLRYHQGKSQSNNPQPWPYTSNRPSNYGGGGGVGGIPVPVPVPQALPPRKFSPGILRFSRTRGSVPQHAQREVNLRHNQSYIDYLPRMVVQRGEGREGLFASGVVGAQNSPPPSPLKNKYPSPLLRDLVLYIYIYIIIRVINTIT